MEKIRLDQLLVKKGMVPSREKGRALIMAGQVYVNGVKVEKAGTPVSDEDRIHIRGELLPYVSRGGLKLAKAIEVFHLNFSGKIVLDIGASTGGFTDCALQNGARKVYAVDVGYGQLAWSLRQDERVVVLERTNARYLTREQIKEFVDIITIDASFISLKKILPPLIDFLKEEGVIIALIKPQFETGRELVGKKGVVKDPLVHQQVITDIVAFCQRQALEVKGLTFSPIRGPEGNIEFLILLQKKERADGTELNRHRDEQKHLPESAQAAALGVELQKAVQEVVALAHRAFAEPELTQEEADER